MWEEGVGFVRLTKKTFDKKVAKAIKDGFTAITGVRKDVRLLGITINGVRRVEKEISYEQYFEKVV